ncbi:MAG: hypothetical protein NVSMB49_13990 [Ktedonobacteraceae bacterium]
MHVRYVVGTTETNERPLWLLVGLACQHALYRLFYQWLGSSGRLALICPFTKLLNLVIMNVGKRFFSTSMDA